MLDELVAWPPEWETVLDENAADPTIASWDALHRFASGAAIYDWRSLALQKLRDRGVDPIALVETGAIPPEVLVARASEPGAATAIWLTSPRRRAL